MLRHDLPFIAVDDIDERERLACFVELLGGGIERDNEFERQLCKAHGLSGGAQK